MDNQEVLKQAIALLRQGKLVAIPTETVYGLAADAKNPKAILKVFQTKGRPKNHPLIIHIRDLSALQEWAIDIPEAAFILAEKFWPGPLTLVLKKAPHVSSLITGGQETVAIRSPRHPLTQALLSEWNGALVAPSANRYCSISPTSSQHVRDELGSTVDLILEGGHSVIGIESTIIDLSSTPYTLLRQGMITKKDLEDLLCMPLQHLSAQPAVRAPGQHERHYAPQKPTYLTDADDLENKLVSFIQKGLRIAVLSQSIPSFQTPLLWLAMPHEPEAYARVLYAKMRCADQSDCDAILIEWPQERDEAWAGILDRLTRAGHPHV